MKCVLCQQEVLEYEKSIKDKIGNVPNFETFEEALQEIIRLTNDKRSHVMYVDAINWERLKIKVIKKIAKNILKKQKEKSGKERI